MTTPKVESKVLAGPKSWIEGEAIRQLQVTAQLPGMVSAYGMPDLHPGRGHPIGAVLFAKDIIYPYLVGSDIGCGMTLFATGLSKRKAKRDRWAKALYIDGVWEDDETKSAIMIKHGIPTDLYRSALGTIGGGNHFAELLSIDEVQSEELFKSAGLEKDQLYLLIHSGSRGLGEEILRSHTSTKGASGLSIPSEDATTYLQKHDQAVKWAVANREAIATRFATAIGFEPKPIVDLCHNNVTLVDGLWCHRKGATPRVGLLSVIPGSRGHLSYLVAPTGDSSTSGHSLPHGAGRKWTRSDARSRLRDKYHDKDLSQTELGSVVICENKDLMYEEAPDAFKSITTVIADVLEHSLATVVATCRPLITYKMRQEKCEHD